MGRGGRKRKLGELDETSGEGLDVSVISLDDGSGDRISFIVSEEGELSPCAEFCGAVWDLFEFSGGLVSLPLEDIDFFEGRVGHGFGLGWIVIVPRKALEINKKSRLGPFLLPLRNRFAFETPPLPPSSE